MPPHSVMPQPPHTREQSRDGGASCTGASWGLDRGPRGAGAGGVLGLHPESTAVPRALSRHSCGQLCHKSTPSRTAPGQQTHLPSAHLLGPLRATESRCSSGSSSSGQKTAWPPQPLLLHQRAQGRGEKPFCQQPEETPPAWPTSGSPKVVMARPGPARCQGRGCIELFQVTSPHIPCH